ncbi:UDP-N-acetylmuramoyl-L-alanyl-D-glutamate--2,6-diaminopimelate ligase [soil metagenome]
MTRLSHMLAGLHDVHVSGDDTVAIQSIVFDSRKVSAGSMFVALRGGYADGHDYLKVAQEAGAVAALVEPETPEEAVAGFKCVVRATNTRGVLAPLVAAFYGKPSQALTVIGITGTDGKTTSSFYLHQMLERAGLSTGLISTVAVRVPGQPDRSSARQTTPESLDVQRALREMVDAGAQIAIIETTSHALETHRVDSCHFDIGVVTNITREHLDFHGSIENYRHAKGGLLRRVTQAQNAGKRGAVVLNADDPGCQSIASHADGAELLWFSVKNHSDAAIRAENIVASPDSNTFTLIVKNARFPVCLPLPGAWNVANALAAAGAAYLSGCDPSSISGSIENLSPVPGRMEKIDLGQPFTVVVDYAHTPESLRSVLEEARRITNGRVLVAFGSAGERDLEKRFLQGAIAAQFADYSIFTSEDPRFEDPEQIIAQIATGATEHGAVRGVDFDCVEDRRTAVNELIGHAKSGDLVILAGKGHERSMIYGAENRPWDEAQTAREALQQMGFGPVNRGGTQA